MDPNSNLTPEEEAELAALEELIPLTGSLIDDLNTAKAELDTADQTAAQEFNTTLEQAFAEIAAVEAETNSALEQDAQEQQRATIEAL